MPAELIDIDLTSLVGGKMLVEEDIDERNVTIRKAAAEVLQTAVKAAGRIPNLKLKISLKEEGPTDVKTATTQAPDEDQGIVFAELVNKANRYLHELEEYDAINTPTLYPRLTGRRLDNTVDYLKGQVAQNAQETYRELNDRRTATMPSPLLQRT